MDFLLPPFFSLFAFGFFHVASFGIIGLLITKFILAIHFTIQTRLPEVRGYRVISFHLYRCVLHFFNLLYLFISLFPLHTISIPFCICIHLFHIFPMFNIPPTRPLPTWTKHRHDDLRIPVPTFAPATETIYNLDAPLTPTGHQFHGVLGDLPPDQIISDSISRWTPHGMPYYHRERLYVTTNIITRTFPRDVSCIRLGVVARQPVWIGPSNSHG